MSPAFPGAAEAGAAELLPAAKWEEEFPNSQLYQSYFCPAPPPLCALITSKAGAAGALSKGFALCSPREPPGKARRHFWGAGHPLARL